VRVDPRKSKRLAHRIRSWARQHRMPNAVVTSPLRRAADVGRWLAAWGWSHRIDARLSELDFGEWDGQTWEQIGKPAVDAWMGEFSEFRPGDGESVSALIERCAAFIADADGSCVVGHAGWIGAALWLGISPGEPAVANRWPPAVKYGQRVTLR